MANFISPIKDCYWTSAFGWRTHPVTGVKQSWHQGIDLAKQPNTDVEVLAAADGRVVRVGPLSTYGNIVIIQHTINGKIMETNYAHLKDKSTVVKVGQSVKQGQKIAIMGSTGSSTAPHLHFEIHNGKWATGQPNAVNPASYIKFIDKSSWLKAKEVAELAAKKAKEEAEKKAREAAEKAKKEAEELAKKIAEEIEKKAQEAKKKAEEDHYKKLAESFLQGGVKLNATGKEAAKNMIKKGIAEKLFTSKHEKIDTYTDVELVSFALAYMDRWTNKVNEKLK